MSWKKHFNPVNSVMPVQNTANGTGASLSRFSSWLPEVYQGPPNRLQRYTQYEQMDFDHEVHSALDIIAEFSTQLDETTKLPFVLNFIESPSEEELKILQTKLRHWCTVNNFPKRIFKIFRSVLKYGDQFFIRDPETHVLYWVDPSTVEKISVNESGGKKVEAYHIKDLDLNIQSLIASDLSRRTESGYGSADSIFPSAPLTGQANFVTGRAVPRTNVGGASNFSAGTASMQVDAKHVVHLSLSEGMDDSWPFGVSELEKIFKIYKQKELLEESLIIYRVHRAPERRVFSIDVGSMPPNRATQYIERVKNDIQQKRIPSKTGGGANIMDSSYNPMSILEDYFFAVTSDGRGSKVDTLPGGENLGQMNDVLYFNNKMLRALGVPSSYLPTGPEDGTFIYNDGRVGTAFIQEYRFQMSCKRHQSQIIEILDKEFKQYLEKSGFNIDPSLYTLEFTEPQSFSQYREIELNNARIQSFTSLGDVPYMSKRFLLQKYLGWTEADIITNERMWKEEQGDLSEANASPAANMRDTGFGPADFDSFSGGDDLAGGDLDAADLGDDTADSLTGDLDAAMTDTAAEPPPTET